MVIKIKEVSPSTKIIILTSHERNEEVIAALGSGANAYCLKDITPETLSSVIKNVAEGACWVDAAVSSAALNFFPKPENVSFISTNEVQDARAQLTERELEVLKHLVKGKSNTEIAKELIELYAKREKITGYAFSKDTDWQKQFEDSFEYTETKDQLLAIEQIKEHFLQFFYSTVKIFGKRHYNISLPCKTFYDSCLHQP